MVLGPPERREASSGKPLSGMPGVIDAEPDVFTAEPRDLAEMSKLRRLPIRNVCFPLFEELR